MPHTHRIRYWADAIGAKDLLKAHREKIQTVLDGARFDKQFEKLEGHNLYSLRTSQKGRLLLTTEVGRDGKPYLLVLAHLDNHEYDKSPLLQKKGLARFREKHAAALDSVTDNDFTNLADDAIKRFSALTASDEESKCEIESQAVYYIAGLFISLDDKQQQAHALPLPLCVTGGAGSGKTSVAMTVLSQWVSKTLRERQQARFHFEAHCKAKTAIEPEAIIPPLIQATEHFYYISRSEALAKAMRESFENLPIAAEDEVKVHFLSYEQWLLKQDNTLSEKRAVCFEDFNTWLQSYRPGAHKRQDKSSQSEKELLHSFKHAPHAVYQDLALALAYDEQRYRALGKNQCHFIEDAEKTLILKLKVAYLTFLEERKYFDSALHFLEVTEHGAGMVVDEMQDFSPVELMLLRKANAPQKDPSVDETIQQHRRVFVGDARQVLRHLRSGVALLTEAGFHHLDLSCNYRCPEHVVQFANEIGTLARTVNQGSVDTVSGNDLIASTKTSGHLSLEPVMSDEAWQKIRQHYHLGQIALVVSDEVMRDKSRLEKVKARYQGIALVFSAEQIKGLEYPVVIIDDYFAASKATHALNTKVNNITDTEKAFRHRAKVVDNSHDQEVLLLTGLYAAVTRAQNEVHIVQPKNHRNEHIVNHLQTLIQKIKPVKDIAVAEEEKKEGRQAVMSLGDLRQGLQALFEKKQLSQAGQLLRAFTEAETTSETDRASAQRYFETLLTAASPSTPASTAPHGKNKKKKKKNKKQKKKGAEEKTSPVSAAAAAAPEIPVFALPPAALTADDLIDQFLAKQALGLNHEAYAGIDIETVGQQATIELGKTIGNNGISAIRILAALCLLDNLHYRENDKNHILPIIISRADEMTRATGADSVPDFVHFKLAQGLLKYRFEIGSPFTSRKTLFETIDDQLNAVSEKGKLSAEYHRLRAAYYLELLDYEQAESHIEKARDIAPDDSNIALIAFEIGLNISHQSCEAMQQLLVLACNNPSPYFAMRAQIMALSYLSTPLQIQLGIIHPDESATKAFARFFKDKLPKGSKPNGDTLLAMTHFYASIDDEKKLSNCHNAIKNLGYLSTRHALYALVDHLKHNEINAVRQQLEKLKQTITKPDVIKLTPDIAIAELSCDIAGLKDITSFTASLKEFIQRCRLYATSPAVMQRLAPLINQLLAEMLSLNEADGSHLCQALNTIDAASLKEFFAKFLSLTSLASSPGLINLASILVAHDASNAFSALQQGLCRTEQAIVTLGIAVYAAKAEPLPSLLQELTAACKDQGLPVMFPMPLIGEQIINPLLLPTELDSTLTSKQADSMAILGLYLMSLSPSNELSLIIYHLKQQAAPSSLVAKCLARYYISVTRELDKVDALLPIVADKTLLETELAFARGNSLKAQQLLSTIEQAGPLDATTFRLAFNCALDQRNHSLAEELKNSLTEDVPVAACTHIIALSQPKPTADDICKAEKFITTEKNALSSIDLAQLYFLLAQSCLKTKQFAATKNYFHLILDGPARILFLEKINTLVPLLKKNITHEDYIELLNSLANSYLNPQPISVNRKLNFDGKAPTETGYFQPKKALPLLEQLYKDAKDRQLTNTPYFIKLKQTLTNTYRACFPHLARMTLKDYQIHAHLTQLLNNGESLKANCKALFGQKKPENIVKHLLWKGVTTEAPTTLTHPYTVIELILFTPDLHAATETYIAENEMAVTLVIHQILKEKGVDFFIKLEQQLNPSHHRSTLASLVMYTLAACDTDERDEYENKAYSLSPQQGSEEKSSAAPGSP